MSECWNDERCKYPEEIGMSVCSDCKNRIIYELEKKNEKLIRYAIDLFETGNMLSAVSGGPVAKKLKEESKNLLEQITGKPIEEIIKDNE